MKKLLSGLCVSALAISFAIAPVAAAPMIAMPSVDAAAPSDSGVLNVQFNDNWRRMERRVERRDDRRGSGRFERRGNYHYYNGHRGYRQARPGYRQYNGFWFPGAAFIAGAIVSGAIQAERSGGGSAHVQWFYDRYRSYRASDNTFQPYNGGRQRCYSPYS